MYVPIVAQPALQPTIIVSVLEIDWLYVFDATIAKPYDSPMSEADGSKTRHVDINRHPLRQEAIKEGLDGQECARLFVKPEQHSFPTRHLFPARTGFSVLRFLTRLLQRF